MISRDRRSAKRGSWSWALNVAEIIAWGTVALVAIIVLISDLPNHVRMRGLVVTAALAFWIWALFTFFVEKARLNRWVGIGLDLMTLGFGAAIFGILRGHVPSSQLALVAAIVATAMLSTPAAGFAIGIVGSTAYWVVAALTGGVPELGAGLLNSGVFVLSGSIAGLLSREVRKQFQGQQEEHRLAAAVRHRLLAVVDAVDEAIVFRDRQGAVRVINRRAGALFGVDPDDFLGLPGAELLRTIARKTEDPEGYMETFQELRDDPEGELRSTIEQILPERRQLRLYSGPTFDELGALVGRIDVYTDITETAQHAAEIERLYDEARKTAESYQRSLLPDGMPNLPRVSIVARYIPAAGSRAVCGDFYDFIAMADGKMGITLGDVCGIGPSAANGSALARYTLRTFLSEDSEPSSLFERMNTHISGQINIDRFIRLLFGVLDPERATFDYVNAGHVPPVVYRARSREVEWLDEGGIAMGVEDDAEYKTGHIELEPGDMLVLYTDGVTEAPRDSRPFGQGRFMDLVQLYGVGTPGELVQALRRGVDAWVGEGDLRDDLALLVLQVVPDSTLEEPEREIVLPNESARLGEIRRFVRGFLAEIRAPVEISQDILLAVGEAAANAARHGRREAGRSEVRIGVKLEGTEVVVTIADDGGGFDMNEVKSRERDRFAAGGRGLFLMQELMDSVTFETSAQGTKVVIRHTVFPPGTPMSPGVARALHPSAKRRDT
jgi:serine phosphatase RsbU (regulator of sigma subunit)/anti-sigma regulatory factor (Ser/Thr protein kinase)